MVKAARERHLGGSVHRLSVSLSPEQHAEVVEIANMNKVSVAWVVREAIERLLHDQHPLFHIRQPR